MDKNTYLKELARHLERWMPEQERQDLLRWYEEYFQEAGPDREAEVMAELGAPEALSRRLEEESGGSRAGKRSYAGLGLAAALAVLAVICFGIYRAGGAANGDVSHTDLPPASESSSEQLPVDSSLPGEQPLDIPGSSNEQPPKAPSSMDGSAQAVEEFASIHAELSLGDVTVRADGAEFLVEARCSGSEGSLPYQIEYWVEDGTLRMESVPKNLRNGTDCEAWVTVTVPENWALEEIDVSTGLGDGVLSGLTAREVELKTGLGDLEWDGLSAREATMSSGLGDIVFRGAPAEEMELDTGMGDIRVQLDCASSECSYELSTGMGEVTVEGQKRGTEAEHDLDSAPASLEASSGMGAITLSFQ